MSISLDLTTRFYDFVFNEVKFRIEEKDIDFILDDLLKVEEILKQFIEYIEEKEGISIDIDEIDIEEDDREWIKEKVESNWDDFIKTQDVEELVTTFLEENHDYQNFFWDVFIEDLESLIEDGISYMFLGKEFVYQLPKISISDDKELITYEKFIDYLKNKAEKELENTKDNEEYSLIKFIDDMINNDLEWVFKESYIEIKTRILSEYGNDTFNLEVKLLDFREEECSDEDFFIETNFEEEKDSWEKMMEKGWTEDMIKENLSYIYYEMEGIREKIEEFYEDKLNENFYNNPKYNLEFAFEEAKNMLLSSSKVFFENTEKVNFLMSIKNIEDVLSIHKSKIFLKSNLLLKYKKLLSDEAVNNIEKFSNFLFKNIKEDNEYTNFFISYGNGTYDALLGKELFIKKTYNSSLFGIRYFKEDKESVFKVFNSRIDEYEPLYNRFLKSVEKYNYADIIDMLKDYSGEKQKEIISYINYRMFEDYFSNDNLFFKKNRESIIGGANILKTLYPTEFVTFLVCETTQILSKEREYPLNYVIFVNFNNETSSNKTDLIKKVISPEKIEKSMFKVFKKIVDNEKVRKIMTKTLALYPVDLDEDFYSYDGVKYLENELIKPLSLYNNPAQDIANILTAKKILEVKLKELKERENKKEIDLER